MPTFKDDTTSISAVVHTEVKRILREIADERTRQQQESGDSRRVSPSDIVREALEDYLKKQGYDVHVTFEQGSDQGDEIEDMEEWTLEEQIEEFKTLYPEFVTDGVLDVEKVRADVIEGFQQGWHEAMTGQTHPIETLWDDIDEED